MYAGGLAVFVGEKKAYIQCFYKRIIKKAKEYRERGNYEQIRLHGVVYTPPLPDDVHRLFLHP